MPLGEPETTRGVQLVVDDIDAARKELIGRGLQITDVQHSAPRVLRARSCILLRS